MAPKPPALDPSTVAPRTTSVYPPEFAKAIEGREKRALGNALGLSHFGVNLVTLPPGVMSSQRHWHANEDEFVFVVEGELTLVTNGGEQVLGPGMAAGFPAGAADGHHLVNRSHRPARYLEVGDRAAHDRAEYPDVDMRAEKSDGKFRLTHKDGTPYPND